MCRFGVWLEALGHLTPCYGIFSYLERFYVKLAREKKEKLYRNTLNDSYGYQWWLKKQSGNHHLVLITHWCVTRRE